MNNKEFKEKVDKKLMVEQKRQEFFQDLMIKDFEAYQNYPYTYPNFTMIGMFQRLFGIKSKYYKKYQKVLHWMK